MARPVMLPHNHKGLLELAAESIGVEQGAGESTVSKLAAQRGEGLLVAREPKMAAAKAGLAMSSE